MIKIKRIYDSMLLEDGFRILIDRLWPRGLKKEDAHFDLWLKEIAPSTELRKWFNHEPEKWQEFKNKYFEELSTNKAVQLILEECEKNSLVTLLYAAHDHQFNHAVVLQNFLINEIGY
ncbi:DUF488 domain-containing protein [Pedobacter sp. B4-66]|uniref:DUF488 domain-containing protein n=1 Tax=Pedobacter sp. B4-66 TaxID=2817280 RepID=UPI001BDA716E|nr:DUF488 domain-containing protein [Pedobacter sp. B4-66]